MTKTGGDKNYQKQNINYLLILKNHYQKYELSPRDYKNWPGRFEKNPWKDSRNENKLNHKMIR